MNSELRKLADEGKQILDTCKIEDRGRTPDEERRMGEINAKMLELRAQQDETDAFLKGGDGEVHEISVAGESRGGPGDMFIRSKEWKSIADPASRPQQWHIGPVEVSKTQFLAKAGTTLESGQGAGLTPVPQVETGIVTQLFQPIAVMDLIPSAPATTSSVRYMNEGTATSGAAGVAEGATKPASDMRSVPSMSR